MSSPVRVSKVMSFTTPRRLPSFVTTGLLMNSLRGFLSIGILAVIVLSI